MSAGDTELTPTESYNDAMTDATIEMISVCKRYGQTVALDGMSFSVQPGRVTGFIGPNGAGKSTAMRVILGLDAPDEGTALVGGQPYRTLHRPLTRVGALLDADALQPSRSGRNHLLWMAQSQRISAGRVDEVIDMVGLTGAAKRKAGGYSLGMRQRLGIAAALMRSPRLLVLDEPTNGLDPKGIREIRDLLAELNQAGTTVFMSSHQLGEVEQLCTRVGIVDRGRLVLQQDLDELRAPTGRVVVRTPDADQAAALLAGHVDKRDDDRLVVAEADPAAVNARLVAAGLRVAEIGPERRSLEDLMLAVTGSGSDRIDRPGPADEEGRVWGGRPPEASSGEAEAAP